MSAYYNENDPFAAAWLRELIKAKLIADGEVDERSIEAVEPADLVGFRQCHFFAGIGGWSYALRLAGWSDDREIWTGSCPCQPFSSAGTQAGGHDARDLWPAWFQLIRECRPHVIFGEQVESAIGHGWLDRLCDDLEREGYAIGACGVPAASVGAYHIRQRLWFVADAAGARRERQIAASEGEARHEARLFVSGSCGELGESEGANQWRFSREPRDQAGASGVETRATNGNAARSASGMGHTGTERLSGRECAELSGAEQQQKWRAITEPSDTLWSGAEWLYCRDGKHRPVEPGTSPLAHGVSGSVGRLRGYGNAIVPQVAQVFIEAYMQVCEERQ